MDRAEYFKAIESLKAAVITSLKLKDAPENLLQFGGPGAKSAKTPRVPTDARSEFLANRAMGDWAEDLLATGLRAALPDCKVCHYGDSDRIPAGAPGFKEFYIERLEDVRIHGKRPDLLVFPKAIEAERDLASIRTDKLTDLVKNSLMSIEVRSSKFEALHYMRVKAERRKSSVISDKDVPSFTVKIEDLRIVYRWIEQHGIQQMYCQVFFDSVFAINFLEIMRIIASRSGYRLEKPDKSQGKNTIMIPVTSGHRIDTSSTVPDFRVERKRTELGRHDAYVVPTGGSTTIDAAAFRGVFA
jgi:hypothetical protein